MARAAASFASIGRRLARGALRRLAATRLGRAAIFKFRGNRLTLEGPGNSIQIAGRLHRCDIVVKGSRCILSIADGANCNDLRILVHGNDCTVSIDAGAQFVSSGTRTGGTVIWVEDDRSSVTIGPRCLFAGDIRVSATEGRRIEIGGGSMLAHGATVMNGDSHAVWDGDQRLNPAGDVLIGERCWIGDRATVLKGVTLPQGTIVGAGSIVTSGPDAPGCIMVGSPARVVRRGVTWTGSRAAPRPTPLVAP